MHWLFNARVYFYVIVERQCRAMVKNTVSAATLPRFECMVVFKQPLIGSRTIATF